MYVVETFCNTEVDNFGTCLCKKFLELLAALLLLSHFSDFPLEVVDELDLAFI